MNFSACGQDFRVESLQFAIPPGMSSWQGLKGSQMFIRVKGAAAGENWSGAISARGWWDLCSLAQHPRRRASQVMDSNRPRTATDNSAQSRVCLLVVSLMSTVAPTKICFSHRRAEWFEDSVCRKIDPNWLIRVRREA
jgi:hypothetical protein